MAYETLTHQERNPLMRDPGVANQIRKKMTLGKSVLIVKVFVIDPRSKSLGKSTALNGSWQQNTLYGWNLLLAFCFISLFYGVFRRNFQCIPSHHIRIQQNPVHNVCLFVTLCCEVRGYFYISFTHILTLAR